MKLTDQQYRDKMIHCAVMRLCGFLFAMMLATTLMYCKINMNIGLAVYIVLVVIVVALNPWPERD